MEILDLSKDRKMQGFMEFITRVNNAIRKEHGRGFNLNPPAQSDAYFTFQQEGHRLNGVRIRLNSVVPNQELFSLAQQLIKSKDEPFMGREIFAADSSFHAGSQTVGFDLVSERGEAKLYATGRVGDDIQQAKVTIDRNLSHVGVIKTSIKVTRDAILGMELRRARGIAPMVDLLQEELSAARKFIARHEDQIIWNGGKLEGTSQGEVQGLWNRFSKVSNNFDGPAPTHGRHDDGLASWIALATNAIIAQIAVGVAHIGRHSAFKANTLALPPEILLSEDFGLRRTSDTDSTPLVDWLRRAIKNILDVDLKIVGTTALKAGDVVGTKRRNTFLADDAFLLLDADKANQAVAVVEDMVLLPSITDEEGTIIQVVQSKTGGLQVTQPSAMYLGEGIRPKS